MGTLKEEAQAYQPQAKTLNVADLPEVSVGFTVEDDSFEADGKEIKIKVINVNGQFYRIPASVLEQLKVHLDANPTMEKFKVSRAGTGMNTKYTVIPLAN